MLAQYKKTATSFEILNFCMFVAEVIDNFAKKWLFKEQDFRQIIRYACCVFFKIQMSISPVLI